MEVSEKRIPSKYVRKVTGMAHLPILEALASCWRDRIG